MEEVIAKVKVVLKALPTYLAAATVILTVVATQVVPLLPENIAVQVAGWIASILGIIAATVSTISRLTPILDPADKGLLPPPSPPQINEF